MRMFRYALAVPAALILSAGLAFAADFGTPAEAKAMLEKAVAEVTKDKAAALEKFAKGEGGFKDRDLYPFCGGPDGNFSAHPSLTGKSLMSLMDKGTPPKALGTEIYAAAQPGKIAEVSYVWTRPDDPEKKPTDKVAYVTKVGDQVCAVGYYK